MLTQADGQLATSATTIFTQGQSPPSSVPGLSPGGLGGAYAVSFNNTSGSVTQTILLFVQRASNGSTTNRRIARCVLGANEQFQANGVVLGPGDILQAQTTTASVVDYVVSDAPPAPFETITFDATGQVKQANGTGAIATAITSTSASAFSVGANGATNPVFNVDDSGTTPATGISIKGAAAASGVAMQVITSGTNEALTIDAAAAALVKIGTVASTAQGLQVGSSTSAANTQLIVQSTNAAALVVGRLGATTPALTVNANAATSVTGVTITSAASGAGVSLAALGGNSNEKFLIDAVGSGPIYLGSVSTGGANVRLPVATVAASGTAIGNAAAVVEGFTYVSGANNANAVKLPAGAVGMQVILVNTTQTATLQVFPQVNNLINNLANNAVYNIPNGARRVFTYAVAGTWYTDPQTIL